MSFLKVFERAEANNPVGTATIPIPINTINVVNIEGPLNHLSNNWKFTDKKNGITEVTFDIDFEIKNKFLNSLMVVSFQFGLEKIADAFQKRAEELFSSSKN